MLIGVKANIKTRYGKLCGEPSSSAFASSRAFTDVSNETGAVKWAQTGFLRMRNAGSTTIAQYRYAEMQGDQPQPQKIFDAQNAPAEGTTNEYKCDLDRTTGTWSFFYAGTVWKSFQDDFWKNATGTTVQWTGEIYNKEDDMPGTEANKCNFSACRYNVDGIYQDAGLVPANVASNDPNEWGAEWVSGTAFNIWDKNPL